MIETIVVVVSITTQYGYAEKHLQLNITMLYIKRTNR